MISTTCRAASKAACRIPDHCWALEYARGFIPQMLPFGVADSIFSTVDYQTVFRLFKIYGKATVREIKNGNVPVSVEGLSGALRMLPGVARPRQPVASAQRFVAPSTTRLLAQRAQS